MPYSQQQIEKAEWFAKNLPLLVPTEITVKQSVSLPSLFRTWDAGLDGWDFVNEDENIIATIRGFGDEIISNSDITPVWLIRLCKKIHDQYPFDSIYVNGRFLI